jgi:hypothetical protein
MNDFAVSVIPSFTRSMKEIWVGEVGSGAVFGAESPPNLHTSAVNYTRTMTIGAGKKCRYRDLEAHFSSFCL